MVWSTARANNVMGPGSAKALEERHSTQERFRLDWCVGKGGMGSVYKAYDILLDRIVAVKILHPTLAVDKEAVRLFKREVQLASGISHPNVLRVFDFGELRGAKLISMAYIDSPNLREIIRRAGRLSWVQSVNYGVQICAGLEAAHTVGVIHRDLKPQNILIDRADHVYLADFGLAKALNESHSLVPWIDHPVGTPCYMSPEQCLGLPADQRTDIFSFGAVLHAMLTGEPPLVGDSTENNAARGVVLDEAKLVESGAPQPLLEILRRCLRFGPEERYPEVADILAELRPLSERAGDAGPDGGIQNENPRRIRWRSFLPRIAVASCALAAIILLWVGGIGALPGASSPFALIEPAASPDSRVRSLLEYQQGKALLNNWKSVADLRSAVDHLESAVSHNAGFSAAHADIVTAALLLYRQTRERPWLDRASLAAETAQAVDGQAAHTRIAAARMLIARDRHRDAVAVLEQVIEEREGTDEAYRLLAQAHLGLGSQPEAIRCSEKAVAMNPSSWQNHCALGATYYTVLRPQEAEPAFRRALELNPEAAAPLHNLGAICLQAGRFEEAISIFEQSLRLAPAPETYSNIGTLYFLTERYQLAVMSFEKALSLRPESDVLAGNLGWAYQLAGLPEEATRMLARAIELAQSRLEVAPTDRSTRRRLALYYAKSADIPAAESILANLRAEAPEDQDLLYTQAVVRVLGGRTETAMEYLDRALQAGFPAILAFADPAWRQLREHEKFRALRQRHYLQSQRGGDESSE